MIPSPLQLLISLLIVAFPLISSAQQLNYEVFKGNKQIGEMVVKRQKTGDKEVYSSDSQMKVSFIVSVDLRFVYNATFQNGLIQKSTTQNFRNGDLHDESIGKRVGASYQVEREGETFTVDSPIDYCILTTYYKEPIGRTEIYSERWGAFIPVKKIDKNKYELSLPNGNENYMTYSNGICTEMEVNHMLATIKFKLVGHPTVGMGQE